MILLLTEMAASFGIRPPLVPIVLALLFTGLALAAPSIARLFEDRNP